MKPRTPALDFDLGGFAPDLPKRTSVRLHPRQAEALAPGCSKLGGQILWPPDEPWPTCPQHGTVLIPVLQLLKSDVPELGFPEGLNLFQLLWCPRDHEHAGWTTWPLACWRSLKADDHWKPNVAAPDKLATPEYLPRECAIHPERVVELPSAAKLKLARISELDDLIRTHGKSDLKRLQIPNDDPLYQYHFSTAPGTKVGGYPQWIQDPDIPSCDCGNSMEYLLTIADAEFDGSYQRWMPMEDRHVWKEGYESRRLVQSPLDLGLGDMGEYYVFCCRKCPAYPVRAIMQCS